MLTAQVSAGLRFSDAVHQKLTAKIEGRTA
jgi:hypothetical protein